MGDRRRRRLAVEAEDGPVGPTGHLLNSAAGGDVRAIDGPHLSPPSDGPAPSSMPQRWRHIPFEWWKYLIAATALSTVAAGLLVAGWKGAELTPVLGPGFERLFAFPAAPATRWYSGALLFVSAELALFIWSARSQSQNDFDGRYRLWIRVACAWLVFSGCVACGVHEVLRDTVLHFRSDLSDRMLLLGWLGPVAVPGVSIFAGLTREMRACRWSHGLLLVAAGVYAGAAGLSFEFESLLAPDGRQVAIQGALLAGHITLFLSMWCHARHVNYCTADPAVRPRSNWRIPRPHFSLLRLRLPQFRRRQEVDKATAPQVDCVAKRQKRSTKAADPEPNLAVEPVEKQASEKWASVLAGKSETRIDLAAGKLSDRSEPLPAPAAQVPVDRLPAVQAADSRPPPGHNLGATERSSQPVPAHVPTPQGKTQVDAGADEPQEEPTKPDMRGLSKKQRRRLMQELRDRERVAGRQ